MCLRARPFRSDSVLRIGLLLLAVAQVAQYLMRRHAQVPESIADPVSGFLFGVAIGTACLGMYLRRGTRCPRPLA